MKPYLLLLIALPSAYSYITEISAVPAKKQISWLKKLTVDICESPTLSDEMIVDATKVMKGWATSKHHSRENAVAAERIVKRLVDESETGNLKATPHSRDYNCVLEGWARSGEGAFAAERCEQILTQMQERYEEGDTNVQPDLSSFKIAIMAWRHSGADFSALRAQRLLEWMVKLHQSGANNKCLPDSDCFDIVLQIYARNGHPDTPRRAEKLLGAMEKLYQATSAPRLRPRTISFNAVLTAWSRSKEENGWRRALDILEFMEKLCYVEGNQRVAPDAITYHIVLGALARQKDNRMLAETVDRIVRRLERRYRLDQQNWLPDRILYNSAMGVWARSNRSGAFRKSRSLLDRQLNFFGQGFEECRPDVIGFTSVLGSCASECGSADEKLKAFNVAVSTFQQLSARADEFGEPNHVTYGTMLKACARLLPYDAPERKKWATQLFQECKERGLVGDMVLSRIREAVPQKDFKKLMEGHSKSQIPASWKKNVHEKNDYRRSKARNRRQAAV